MSISTQRESLFIFTITCKHARGWEIDENNTYESDLIFILKRNVENKRNSPVNIRFVTKTSDIYLRI